MGTFVTKEKLFSAKWFKAYSLILLGSFLVAIGYVFFMTPHKIIPGGVYGISIVLHYLIGSPIGLTALLFNIPLTIIAVKILGPRFGAKTVTGFIATSFFVDLQFYLWPGVNLTGDDTLLAAIFGGLTIGLGVGFIFKARATSGGSDVISMIIAKYTKLPLGQIMIFVDSVIVIFGLVAFGDWKMPLYAWVTIFIIGKVVDTVLQGISYDKTIFIVSDKHELIRDKIINDLNRGGTFIDGTGMYNGAEKKIIFTVVNRREVAILEEHIHSIDPEAFLTVIDANEIIGKGFKSLDEKISD